MKQYIKEKEEELYKKFNSLDESVRKEILEYYSIYSEKGLYTYTLQKAQQAKRYADRNCYGKGEMGYTSRELREDAEEQKCTKNIATELSRLYSAMLDHLFESEL